jgi:hypothetical protein
LSKGENFVSELIDQIRNVIREELKPISERLDRLESNQNDDIVGMLKILSSKVDVLIKGQERQDRILDLLSSRSIDHESQINTLKRLR